MTALILDY